MKKTILLSTMTASLFAFAGMSGGMMQKAHNMTPMKGLTEDKVLSEVNGKKIRVKDVNGYLQGTKKDFRIKLQELPAQHVGQFVEEYSEIEALYPEAKAITSTAPYKAAAKKLAIDLWITKKFNEIKVTDNEITQFYNKYKSLYFKNNPEYKARHIVVKEEKVAEKLINQLKSLNGKKLEEKFAELAQQYSIGPSKIDGGELGYFKLSDMAKPFSEAVSLLKKGTITTKPVQTKYGYHIILLEDKKTDVYVPLKKVKMQILYHLKTQKLNKELDKIREKANIKYHIKISH